MRRRLLSSLDEPQTAEAGPRTDELPAAIDPPAPSTPPAAAGGGFGAPFGPATEDARRGDPTNLQRGVSRAAVPRAALLPAEVQPGAAAAASGGANHGALLAALLPRAKPKHAPALEARTNGHAPTHVATDDVRCESSCTQTVWASFGDWCICCWPAAGSLPQVFAGGLRVMTCMCACQQGMASSMGGSPPAPSADCHPHRPGQYRGAADLDMQNGTVLFAGYGAPNAPLPMRANLNGDTGTQLHFRQLSHGSDGIAASSPLSRCVSDVAGLTDPATAHSRSSSGWTGFDGPSYAFASGMNGLGTAAASDPGADFAESGLHGRPAVLQQLISLHDVERHSDLRLHLQRTSLGDANFDIQPHDYMLPSVVNGSVSGGDDSIACLHGAFGMQTLQHCGASGDSRVVDFRTEDEALPRELIGNLDLYL